MWIKKNYGAPTMVPLIGKIVGSDEWVEVEDSTGKRLIKSNPLYSGRYDNPFVENVVEEVDSDVESNFVKMTEEKLETTTGFYDTHKEEKDIYSMNKVELIKFARKVAEEKGTEIKGIWRKNVDEIRELIIFLQENDI